MKLKFIYFIAVVTILVSCIKEKETIQEVPPGIIRDTTDRVALYEKIEDLFPENNQTAVLLPTLFTDTVLKQIVLTKETEVYITFILERALYKNTVGWYSYTPSNKPTKVSEINMHILFPNVSGVGEGGELLKGDMLQLGSKKFPQGTVIGFFLIVNGWNNGEIRYSNVTHYTDYNFNVGGNQQHVLFKDKVGGEFVLGFEDRLYAESDKDFNDILFIISDNKEGLETISFDLVKLPIL